MVPVYHWYGSNKRRRRAEREAGACTYFLSSDNPGQKLGQAVSPHENHFPSAMRRELTTYLTGSTEIAVTIVQSLLPPLGVRKRSGQPAMNRSKQGQYG
jgi:hypothetical protein